jgi:hypothetical protein
MHTTELPWAEFKAQCLDAGWQYIYFDINNHYNIYAKNSEFTVLCKIHKDDNADQIDFENAYKDAATTDLKSGVQTQFERDDIVLKLCRGEAAFDGSGDAEISFPVPGTPGSGDGRYVAGGYAFTDVFGFGDYVSQVNIVDVDNILGMGAHTVLQTYHDTDIDSSQAGWYFWPNAQVGGEVELDPIGYYGFIPSGLYLEVYFKRKAGNTATTVYCDVWWGKSYE